MLYAEMSYIEGSWGEWRGVTEHNTPLPRPGVGETELQFILIRFQRQIGYLCTIIPDAVADDPLVKPYVDDDHRVTIMDKTPIIDLLARRFYADIRESAILMWKLHQTLAGYRWRAYANAEDAGDPHKLRRIQFAVKRWLLLDKMHVIVKQHGEYEFAKITVGCFLEYYINGMRAIVSIMTSKYDSHAVLFSRNTDVQPPRYLKYFTTTVSTNTKGYATTLKKVLSTIDQYDCPEGFIIVLTKKKPNKEHRRINVHVCEAAIAHMLQDILPMSPDTKHMMIDIEEITTRKPAETYTYDDDKLYFEASA